MEIIESKRLEKEVNEIPIFGEIERTSGRYALLVSSKNLVYGDLPSKTNELSKGPWNLFRAMISSLFSGSSWNVAISDSPEELPKKDSDYLSHFMINDEHAVYLYNQLK